MEIAFPVDFETKVKEAAAFAGRPAEDYVRSLVERHIDEDMEFRKAVREGMASLDRGEYLTHEEVGARLEKMFKH